MPKEIKQTIYLIIATFFVLCTFPVSFSLAIMYWLYTKLFRVKTQESIVQWFEVAKTNCSVSEMDEVDDYYIDPKLLIVEWDDNGLRQRNINKNNIATAIRTFRGVRPVSDILANLVFCIFDAPPVENQQIAQDIIAYLRQTYYQANQPSLGRVFKIMATAKGKFEIQEDHQ
ncbi:2642_t:CDS:2, partial [Gigaspora rosea]